MFGALLAIACYFTRISRVWLFWTALILTRRLDATVGDFFDKPIANGGLNVSPPLASAIIAAFILICRRRPLFEFWRRGSDYSALRASPLRGRPSGVISAS